MSTVEPPKGAGLRGAFLPITARRLSGFSALATEDLKLLSALKGRTFRAGAKINDVAETPSMLLSGWCARVISHREQGPQVANMLLPGDGLGIAPSAWAGDRLPVLMLTDCVLVDASPVRNAFRSHSISHSQLIEACEKAAKREQDYVLDHVMRLGALDAYRRVAHLFVELYRRFDAVGMVHGNGFAFPLKQQVLAEVLGLSTVHFNRVIRKLKSAGLLALQRGEIACPDITKLAELAGSAALHADAPLSVAAASA